MTIVDRISAVNNMMQSSFKNAITSVENIHQTAAEIPLEFLQEFGYPEERAEKVRESHRRVLRVLYGGICDAHEKFGDLLVMQASGLTKFVGGMAGAGNWTPPAGKTQPTKKASGAKKPPVKAAPKKAKKKSIKQSASGQADGEQPDASTGNAEKTQQTERAEQTQQTQQTEQTEQTEKAEQTQQTQQTDA